jgi:hypothetical protein
MYARLTYFDGPRSPELIAAAERGSRDRIEPALAARPDIMDDLVAMYDLRQPDGGQLVVAIANHMETLDKAVEVINSTPLLPGEDVALLPGPDRVETYQVARTQGAVPALSTR